MKKTEATIESKHDFKGFLNFLLKEHGRYQRDIIQVPTILWNKKKDRVFCMLLIERDKLRTPWAGKDISKKGIVAR